MENASDAPINQLEIDMSQLKVRQAMTGGPAISLRYRILCWSRSIHQCLPATLLNSKPSFWVRLVVRVKEVEL